MNARVGVFPSIGETGAQPGDEVLCVTTDNPARYTVGKVYAVVSHLGRPHVIGDRAQDPVSKKKAGDPMPFEGWGATWRTVRHGKA
ncbi:hypothetical protein HYN69_10490 [Gemmobacter aquarius]|uniref:Uncharacterized protein n=1 Tax=Paragemmobacter aquarius TaxID=2169400 RepID=A0A2S0UM53_9RHOB|nr:hypothetical protein [Gemmobacter aquarius]AWB48871.1 hypothetical protein HYN69_10490 [Gemmobacter aquarius]